MCILVERAHSTLNETPGASQPHSMFVGALKTMKNTGFHIYKKNMLFAKEHQVFDGPLVDPIGI